MSEIQQHMERVIRKGLEQGFRADYIRKVLLDKGYTVLDVDMAFRNVHSHPQGVSAEAPQPRPRQEQMVVSAQSPGKAVYVLGALCVILFIGLLVSLMRPPTVVEVEKIVEVPVVMAAQEPEMEGTLRERLDSLGELSKQLDDKQERIDQQLAVISGLSVDVNEKDRLIGEQRKELAELTELRKQERKQVVSVLVEVLNYILGRTQRVSG